MRLISPAGTVIRLNYAKLEAGTVRYDAADIPLHDVVTAAAGLIAPQAGAKGLTLTSDHVRVSVRDTGLGVPPDKLKAIFEPFVRVGRALNQPGEGTGLGLAISRDLARWMGGDLTVESQVGVGSTFTLTLPPTN